MNVIFNLLYYMFIDEVLYTSRKVAKLCALSLNNLALESGGERTIANNSGTGDIRIHHFTSKK